MNAVIMSRINRVYNMHECIRNWGGDEEHYMRWILIVPDCPTMEDFYDIAEDMTDYKEVCDLFWDIIGDMVKEDCFENVYNYLKKCGI